MPLPNDCTKGTSSKVLLRNNVLFTNTLRVSAQKGHHQTLYTNVKRRSVKVAQGIPLPCHSSLSSCYLLTVKAAERKVEGVALPCKCDLSCLDRLDDVHFHTSLRLFLTLRSTDFVITDTQPMQKTTTWSSSSRDLFYRFYVPIWRSRACHVTLTPKPPFQISFDIWTLLRSEYTDHTELQSGTQRFQLCNNNEQCATTTEDDVCVNVHHWYNNTNSQLDATIIMLLIISISSTCFGR